MPNGSVLSTPEEIAHEQRAAEGAIWTGSRLVIGIGAFGFASLAFAYFYLRSENNEALWRPGRVTASVGIGTAIMIITLFTVAFSMYGTWRRRNGSMVDWHVAGWLTVFAGLLSLVIEIVALFELHFYPGSSGYASCFVAWAIMNSALLLSGVYWTETILARAIRLHRAVQEEGTVASQSPVAPLTDIEIQAANHYWAFIGLVGVVFWLMMYIIV